MNGGELEMNGGELKTLVPTVQWGQRKDMVVLRVQIALPDDQASNVSPGMTGDGLHLELFADVGARPGL